MAKLITGIDISGNTLTFTIPNPTVVANAKTIAVMVHRINGDTLTMKEEPVTGQGGSVTIYNPYNVVIKTFTFPTTGGTFTISDVDAVVESVDTTAVLYDTISREANKHWYVRSEDGARRELISDLGQATGNTTTALYLPDNGDYLIITLSPTIAGYSSIWTVRSELGVNHDGMKLGGDGDNVSAVKATAYALQLNVTVSGSSTVRVYAIRLK